MSEGLTNQEVEACWDRKLKERQKAIESGKNKWFGW
jgi:hypothetical protein